MSTRLVKQIHERAKGRDSKPVAIFMRSGRAFEGELGKIDVPNGTVEIKVYDPGTRKNWTALVNTDLIEAISPRWQETA